MIDWFQSGKCSSNQTLTHLFLIPLTCLVSNMLWNCGVSFLYLSLFLWFSVFPIVHISWFSLYKPFLPVFHRFFQSPVGIWKMRFTSQAPNILHIPSSSPSFCPSFSIPNSPIYPNIYQLHKTGGRAQTYGFKKCSCPREKSPRLISRSGDGRIEKGQSKPSHYAAVGGGHPLGKQPTGRPLKVCWGERACDARTGPLLPAALFPACLCLRLACSLVPPDPSSRSHSL